MNYQGHISYICNYFQNVKNAMTVIIVRTIKLEHATKQMVNVNAVVKLASKKISVKSAKKIIGCRQVVSTTVKSQVGASLC